MGRLIGAAEVARLLGVDVRSLYAYVSRGALARAGTDERRRSLYDSDEVELLARRGRPRTGSHPRAGIDVVIGSSVTTLGDGWIRYRDRDLLDLVHERIGFERVAELLWTGRLPDTPQWTPPPRVRGLIGRVLKPFEPGAHVLDRMAAAAAAVNCFTPSADALVLTLVHAVASSSGVPDGSSGVPDGEPSVAAQLFRRLSPLRPTAARIRALDLALVLLADHELATSTLAVRVAASTGTSLVGAVQAGLGALAGPAHGAAGDIVHRALLDVHHGTVEPQDLARRGTGFGHMVHRSTDPRTAPLLDAVKRIASPRDRSVISSAVPSGPGASAPSVDFALGALCFVTRMPPDAATAVFAVARSAGWAAHAAEESAEKPLRYRARAVARRVEK